MKNVIIFFYLSAFLATPVISQDQGETNTDAVALADSLKILEPLVNRHWVGQLANPGDSRMLDVTREVRVIWDGTVVKFSASIPQAKRYSEGYFYWDTAKGHVALFVVGIGGNVQNGVVTVEDGILTIRGSLVLPDRAFEYRNTLEFTPDGKMVDRWFHNAFGDWQAGHVVEFSEIKKK